ncbi:hypothetical protein SDC9_210503 [bioreactor metagenome]|uniref:Uncharacterized protein n=1 Tax=bioreactor metagenome TaxID=1076179 RepID=A0A645JI18_9ZZZZ
MLDGNAGGVYFLHKRQVQLLGKPHAGRAGERDAYLPVAQVLEQGRKHLDSGLGNLRVVSTILLMNNTQLFIKYYAFHGCGANIQAYFH